MMCEDFTLIPPFGGTSLLPFMALMQIEGAELVFLYELATWQRSTRRCIEENTRG